MTVENQGYATAIIPAYNEQDHIARVLTPLHKVVQLKEIIVVDDGSVDGTAVAVQEFRRQDERVKLVPLAHNRGKGGAVMAGIQASSTDLLVLLDADLINLQPQHVHALLRPVQQRQCVMTLGIFRNGRQHTNLSHRYFSFLSGQRCLRWSAFHHLANFHETRWGIEVALNLTARQQKLPVRQIPWDGVSHMMRLEKRSGFHKYWTYVEMWCDIIKFTTTFNINCWFRNGRSRQCTRSPVIKSSPAAER